MRPRPPAAAPRPGCRPAARPRASGGSRASGLDIRCAGPSALLVRAHGGDGGGWNGDALLQLLVEAEPLLDVVPGNLDQLPVPVRILALGHAEPGLVAHVRGEVAFGRRRIQLERALAVDRAPRVVPVQRP